MNHHRQQFEDQQQALLDKQVKLAKKINRITYYQWVLGVLFVGYLVAAVSYYLSYSELISQWPINLQVLLAIIVCLGSVPLVTLLIICDYSRTLATFQLSLAEKAFDISSAVHAAMSEYLGDALPMYAKHLYSFGLAEEMLAISQDMSRNYERAYSATQLALKTIDEHFGLRNIKHETLKAKVLVEMLQLLLETLTDNQEVADCAEADKKIISLAGALKEKLTDLR